MKLSLPNIEAERVRRNMSKDEFAAFLCVSRRTVQNWQNGQTEIPLSKLVKIAETWKLSVDYLLGLNPCEFEKSPTDRRQL